MKTIIEYTELEKHFKAPKCISPFYNFKRMPRKLKKEFKKSMHNRVGGYEFLDINQKLWYILGYTNPNYKRFLIKQIAIGNMV
jgi:hypothetical protein